MTAAREAQSESTQLAALLEFLKQTRGFDFTGYKRSSLERRIRKRMGAVRVDSYDAYQDFLEANPGEFTDLFNTILINVTGFFRDKAVWDYVSGQVIPALLDGRADGDPLRVWSAACATGEEAYTTAIVLAEALGEDAFKERVKIYATDVDEDALARARAAIFSSDALTAVPEDLRKKYFEQTPLGVMFRADLRRSVIFGRNDLVQDAPISRIDLLVSRNALMYFTAEAQGRILGQFNFALRDSGFLVVGKSEMLITHTDLFTPHNLKWRVFRKVPRSALRDRLGFVTDETIGDAGAHEPSYVELRNGALDLVPVAQVVVDRDGFVTAVNQRARSLFGLGPAELGRPLQDLELSYRPVELRSALAKAYSEGSAVRTGRVLWRTPQNEALTLDVLVTPLPGLNGPIGAAVSFDDVTQFAALDDEHQRSKLRLENAYEELQSTVEELETTNEELHSTNEELETTNEELHSTNEELETMNEELQSTNDELESVNEDQRVRSGELDRVNMFFEGILGSLGVGVVVLDNELSVQVWNDSSHELWGLRPEEAEGEHFLTLDIGLPVERLKAAIRSALQSPNGTQELNVEAVTRRGKSIRCRVRVLPLTNNAGDSYGVILLTEELDAG
jgi:two-component system, chemotaxis family, CheB/CheR fusion protein